jgi:hypothetical protein
LLHSISAYFCSSSAETPLKIPPYP